jgi:hypothetical protein
MIMAETKAKVIGVKTLRILPIGNILIPCGVDLLLPRDIVDKLIPSGFVEVI